MSLLTLYFNVILITGYENVINKTIEKFKCKYKISKESTANKIININISKTKNGYKINHIDYIDKINII